MLCLTLRLRWNWTTLGALSPSRSMVAFLRPAPFTLDMPELDVTAFVLAGGRSTRMGSDKALLTVGKQTLLERALHTAAAVANKVFIRSEEHTSELQSL